MQVAVHEAVPSPAPTALRRQLEEIQHRRRLRIAATNICEFAATGGFLIAILTVLSFTLAPPTQPSPPTAEPTNHHAATDAVSDDTDDDIVVPKHLHETDGNSRRQSFDIGGTLSHPTDEFNQTELVTTLVAAEATPTTSNLDYYRAFLSGGGKQSQARANNNADILAQLSTLAAQTAENNKQIAAITARLQPAAPAARSTSSTNGRKDPSTDGRAAAPKPAQLNTDARDNYRNLLAGGVQESELRQCNQASPLEAPADNASRPRR